MKIIWCVRSLFNVCSGKNHYMPWWNENKSNKISLYSETAKSKLAKTKRKTTKVFHSFCTGSSVIITFFDACWSLQCWCNNPHHHTIENFEEKDNVNTKNQQIIKMISAEKNRYLFNELVGIFMMGLKELKWLYEKYILLYTYW